MAGRKRLPTQVKLLKGTLQKCRINPSEPRPVGDLSDPPPHLTEHAKAAWRHAIGSAPPNLLKRLDASVLEVWCCAAALFHEAQLGLQATGLLVPAPSSGVPMQSPYLSILNKQAQIMIRAAAEMGFSPASRSRVSVVPEPNHDDEWSTF